MSEKLLMQILEKVTSVETEQIQFKQALFEMHQMLVETNKEVHKNTLGLAETNKEVHKNTLGLAETNKEVRKISSDLAETNKEVRKISSDLKETNQLVMETNATVKRIEYIQDQQHHIIDLLSTRSIEQEATLKRIK